MFGTGKKVDKKATDIGVMSRDQAPDLLVVASELVTRDREQLTAEALQLPAGQRCSVVSPFDPAIAAGISSPYVLSLFNSPLDLDSLSDKVIAARSAGFDTVLVIAVNPTQLVALGQWLDKRAAAGRLQGIRLMIASDIDGVCRQLNSRLKPVTEDNVIRMPATTEVDNASFKNFFVFSPELHALVARIRGFANNGISRACLLGGPGSGKTTLAYYYYLQRAKGKFVSVNLAAESVGDKAAIKSLLCGHVSGAFPGAGARTGAFQHARDGVCFLDESHEINGAVMEVLMEALDNGQYLPYGASAKQPLDCAVLYATNRSWTHLMNSVNLDQFTRLGASTLFVPELAKREEDMIAVVATALAKMVTRCTNWVAPTGLSSEAWAVIRDCRWHGNIRGLVRVLESAFVDTATLRGGDTLIRATEIESGIQLWEPKSHHSHQIYSVA